MSINTAGRSSLTRQTIVPFLLEIFETRGPESYLGESVSMAEHMEQSAACAYEDGASDELIIAALLHDIGHFIGDFELDALENGIDNFHEDSGAIILERFYPPEISEPVRLHVAAKRYLCTVDDHYYDKLSAASVNSFNLQGGKMSASEVAEFEANPHHKAAIKLRHYDDDGKVQGRTIYKIDHYQPLLESLLS
ncbi:HD domain-containing protein [Marinomonas algicola]|uniref:HD domain-containing protein n=1 Tax=Marinomonas algicola TaxID=2773454 RepID=UPI00174E3AC5|nr:HD domain-containing protein [Marinomonas algicola]